MSTSPQRPLILAFFGGIAAILALLVLVGAIIFGGGAVRNLFGGGHTPLKNVESWQVGSQLSQQPDPNEHADLGNSVKYLPKDEAVVNYLKAAGLAVNQVEPLHYVEDKTGATVTYLVHATVPSQLLQLRQTQWKPADTSLGRFAPMLMLNNGLPAGTLWDTQNAAVAAPAGSPLDFKWQVAWDKTSGKVTTDRLPLSDNVYTAQQVSQYQNEANGHIAALQAALRQIDAQVQRDQQARMAQISGNPPKPPTLSSSFGGDGSGEPTKSGERIGGGAVAGAAGGAAFGAAAGDAGLGAGIGAGVGLLGGLVYDSVSKSNDRKRHERAVAAENDERLSDWRAQVKALDQQRAQVNRDASVEREKLLTDLGNRLASAQGRIDAVAATGPETQSIPADKAPSATHPGPDQPSGPIP